MEQPSILVRILHSIPHVNYTFQRVNDTFNPDSDVYLESLGILASIPAGLLILSLFGLLLYLLTRCCDRKPRKPSAQRCQSCSLVIITLMTCAAIGLGLYGNDDFHNGLLQAFSSGKQVEGLVLSLKRQTEAIKWDLETKMNQHKLEAQIEKIQYNQTAVMLLIETCGLVRENTSRAVTSLDNMVLYFMKTKGSENDTSLMGLLHLGELYESIRWPATLGFLTILLLLCTVLVIGVARRSRCALIFFSVAGLFCIIMCWLLAGVYLASAVAAGDFCMRPHEYMCRQVGMRSPYVYFLNCGTLRNRFILRLNESRDLVERARESVYLIQRMSQETYPRIDVHKTLESMDNDLEETKRNLTVLSATLDRRAIDRHYSEALKGLCGGGLLGLSLMMVAGLLTSFLFTILVYADSHAWIYLNKRRPSLDADKSETAPLFPSNAPSANISPTAPVHHTGTINRTLLHHQQTHSVGAGQSGTLGHGTSRSNGTANGLRSGFASYNSHHKTNTLLHGGSGGSGGKSSPSPPPHYDVVVHGTRSGHHTLGRLPSHHQSNYGVPGPNNGKYATLSKQCSSSIRLNSITASNFNGIGRNSIKSMFASATLPRSAGSSLRSVLSAQTSNTVCRSTGNGLDQDDDKDPRDVTNNSFNRFDPKYISIGPKAVRGNNNLNILAAATANKCATLGRPHGIRYGGSLRGTSPSPNLRSAKTPSIATVSKDYCPQPDCIPQNYNVNTTDEIVTPQVAQPPPPPLPPPKPKNTFTEIPGTTGVGSCYAKEQLQLQLQIQQQHQHQHQQQQQQQPQQQYQLQEVQPVPATPTVQRPLPVQHHPPTTHILPPSAVYSIESSSYHQQQQQQLQQQQLQQQQLQQQQLQQQQLQQQMQQQLKQHEALPPTQTIPSVASRPLPPQPTAAPVPTTVTPAPRSLNPNSIVNQPLPEIPTLQSQAQPPPSKISPQPLCAANLNQYRSLQRPQQTKMQLAQPQQTQQQQTQTIQQPPSLPPKNRHKTREHNSNIQTLPPKSNSLRQQLVSVNSYELERDRERDRLHREREREREREKHERPRRSETLDNARSNVAYMDAHSSSMKKQHSYDATTQSSTGYHQRHPTATTPNNNQFHQSALMSKHHQQQLLAEAQHQQQMYYRSLKRGGSHANNDMYSVTEL